ncbi:MAG: hypothetical protein IPI01_02615 [Ignavibacteriae bacterium]|nr:hypothetical protein [Ignavibacteriota bacterium]
MSRNLSSSQFIALLDAVFQCGPRERGLTFMVDLPGDRLHDSSAWMDRRRIATEWYLTLQDSWDAMPFEKLTFCAYPNVGTNNGDLPQEILLVEQVNRHGTIASGLDTTLEEVLNDSSIVLAPTELSSTAPLKVLARRLGFRGATMPGFSRAMIPALGLNYESVNRRVLQIQERMNRASGANVMLGVGDDALFPLHIDLRFRNGHASGGLIRQPGSVANLPSGEAYIVPYEGEEPGERSQTTGVLPVQFGSEVVRFRIKENKAVEVLSEGPAAEKQARLLAGEPAYGNIAELGVGVLSEWGVKPVGSTLLDEKLGLHIAFGRSEHFGGQTGPAQFSAPDKVVHIDWVYVPEVQPSIQVRYVNFIYPDGSEETIIRDGRLMVGKL